MIDKKRHPLRYLPVRTKIFLGYSIVLLASIIIAIYGIVSFNTVNNANARRDRITEARKMARSLDVNVLRIIVNLEYYIDDPQQRFVDELYTARTEASSQRERLRSLTDNKESIAFLNKYEALLEERRFLADAIIVGLREGDQSSVAASIERRRELDTEARSYLRGIIDVEDKASSVALVRINTQIERAQRNIMLLTVPLIFIIIVFGILLSASIRRPLRAIEQLTKRIGQGDFSPSKIGIGKDEFSTLERAFNDMSEALAKLDKSKSEFISLVSHQLRTPATAVKQSLGLIIEGYVDKKKLHDELIKNAYDSNEEQLQIIEDILNIAKIEAGNIAVKREKINIVELVNSSIKQLEASANEHSHKLKQELPSKEIICLVDRIKITMVVENLISNAIKYTPDGGTITVKIQNEPGKVRILVSDTGIGISPEEQKQMFTKFGRIQNDATVKIPGTGLGLYLAKSFVELHGGVIGLESNPGKGTTFSIILPKGE